MELKEIKAGLDKYMAEMDEAKRNAAIALSPKYIVKEHSGLLNDGNDLFYVYAHYPTTEPDVLLMPFVSKVNAELFCEALNAENERREVDVLKLTSMDRVAVPRDTYKMIGGGKDGGWQVITIGSCLCGEDMRDDIHKYCPNCGRRILWKEGKRL